jgi:hypothetical protein
MARAVIIAIVLLFALSCCFAEDARAEHNPKHNHILLRRKTIDVDTEYAPFVGRKKQENSQTAPSWIWSKPAEAEQIMVHYKRRVNADDHFNLESLAGAGSILAYIPTNTYLVQIPRVRNQIFSSIIAHPCVGFDENHYSGVRRGTFPSLLIIFFLSNSIFR